MAKILPDYYRAGGGVVARAIVGRLTNAWWQSRRRPLVEAVKVRKVVADGDERCILVVQQRRWFQRARGVNNERVPTTSG